MHKINHLLDLREKRFDGLVADGTPTSLDTYRRALKNHLASNLGIGRRDLGNFAS